MSNPRIPKRSTGILGYSDHTHCTSKRCTISELFDFVSQNVRKFSDDQQHPVAWGKFADDFPMMDWRKK